MANGETTSAPGENFTQDLFAVQLEVTARLLEAEKKKLTQLELELVQHDPDDNSVDQDKRLEQQKSNYRRILVQHHRLTKEYEEAARGLLRRSTKFRKSSRRSNPHFGLKQTVKSRPSIFGTVIQKEKDKEKNEDVDKKNEQVSSSSKGFSAAFSSSRGGTLKKFTGGQKEVLIHEVGVPVAASLDDLIQRLIPTASYYPERTYIFAFLLCSRLFIHPADLMSRVTQACALQIKTQSSLEGKQVAINLVQLLGEWAESFAYDFRDEKMMTELKNITQYCSFLGSELKRSAGQITQSIFRKLSMLDKYEEILHKASAVAEERRTKNADNEQGILIVCKDPAVLAQQLTHIELERLANIGPEEFIQTFIPKDENDLKPSVGEIKRTSNLAAYIEWFNRLSYLVASEICTGVKKKQRAKIIEYFIEVAKECYVRGNYNSVMALLSGMNVHPVARLRKTWSKVKIAKFEYLELQMSPMSNFAIYRSALKAALGDTKGKFECVIPFFSLFVKDLYFLNEGCLNKLSNGFINFEKFWELAKLISDCVSWKEVQCQYERNSVVLNFLMTAPVYSEYELYLASYECEAPESDIEKERYKNLKCQYST